MPQLTEVSETPVAGPTSRKGFLASLLDTPIRSYAKKCWRTSCYRKPTAATGLCQECTDYLRG